MPKVVREHMSVKGLDPFLVEPALTAGVFLRQLLQVWPTGHLNTRKTPAMTGEGKGEVCNHAENVSAMLICTYGPDVSADHEADILGERINQLKQSRTRVWITSHHQTLWPGNMDFTHT